MKLAIRKQQQPVQPPGSFDLAAFLGVFDQITEQHNLQLDLGRALQIIEPLESSTERKLEAAQKAFDRGNRTISIKEVEQWKSSVEAEAASIRAKISESSRIINLLEIRIGGDPNAIPALEAEVERLEVEAEETRRHYELDVLKRLAGGLRDANIKPGYNKQQGVLKAISDSQNGNLEESREALQDVQQQIQRIYAAIEEARSIKKTREINEQHKNELPKIGDLVNRRNELLDELLVIDEQVRSHHLAHDTWPQEQFKNIKERGAYAFNVLQNGVIQ